MLKLIIILDEVEKGGLDSALFADICRGIINSREQLFGGNMEIALQRYGMLLAKSGENQFHQLVKNPHMQIALKHFINYDFIAKFYNPYYSAISSYSLIKENSDFFLLTINNKSIKYPIMMETNFSCPQRNDLGSLSITHSVDEPKPTTAVDKSNVFKCNLYEAANYNELPLFIIGNQKEILSDIEAISSQSKIQDVRNRDSVVYNIQNSSPSTHYKKY